MSYKDHKKQKEYQKLWRRKRRILEMNIAFEKLGGKCVMCGESNPMVLEIDHIICIRRRRSDINECGNRMKQMIANGTKSVDNLQLLCANCHRIKTYNELYLNGEKQI